MIQLTEEQKREEEKILDAATTQQILCLTGPAGVGKTTLMRSLADRFQVQGRRVLLAAPTGKAAYNLSRKTGRPVSTLHALLYGEVSQLTRYDTDVEWAILPPEVSAIVLEGQQQNLRYVQKGEVYFDTRDLVELTLAEVQDPYRPFWSPTSNQEPHTSLSFGAPRYEIRPNDVLIVDEASMVREDLHREILDQLPAQATLLYVGDREQLPPVGGTWGPDFENPTAALETIHRQAEGNPIIQVAWHVRSGGDLPRISKPGYSRVSATSKAISEWASMKLRAGEDVVLLCYTNALRNRLNVEIRQNLGFAERGLVAVGERVKVIKNSKSKGRMNGELLVVKEIEPSLNGMIGDYLIVLEDQEGRSTAALTRPELFMASANDWFQHFQAHRLHRREIEKYLMLDYGYALTVHSAQGSEFSTVGFVYDSSVYNLRRGSEVDTARRLLYTAVTRASESLRVFDYINR